MQLTKNVFKYLENFSINEMKLDNFDEDSVSSFVNHTPTINDSYISTNDISFSFGNIDDVIIYNLDGAVNLSNRKTIEIDVYTTSDIDENGVTLEVCSGVNGNAIRGSFKNNNNIDGGTLSTLVFDLGNINNMRLRHYSSIRSLRLTINADDFMIAGISAFNSEYMITYEDLVDIVKASNAYVLDKINMDKTPVDAVLYEAIYKLSAYYIWQRASVTPRNTKKGFSYLKTDADELIKFYLTNGYHPHLIPYTDTVRNNKNHGRKNSEELLLKQHKALAKVIYDV